MPDNGLARLASITNQMQIRTKIHDFSTLGTIQRLVPTNLTKSLKGVLLQMDEITLKRRQGKPLSSRDRAVQAVNFLKLKAIGHRLEGIQERFVHEEAIKLAVESKKQGNGFVGFKLWNGDGFTGAVQMAKIIKKYFPEIKIFFGGPQAKFFQDRIFKYAPVDAIAYGDGEETIKNLAEHVYEGRKLSEVSGIIYKNDHGAILRTPLVWQSDINNLPLPDYSDSYPALHEPNSKINIFVVEHNRGCAGKCFFCVVPNLFGDKVRLINAKKVADEMEYIQKTTGSNAFRFSGSTSSSTWLKAIADELNARNISSQFTSFAAINMVNPEHLSYLAKSGLVALFYGVESGDDADLAQMNKKITTETTKMIIKATKDAGIAAVGSVIYPYLTVSDKKRNELVELLTEIRPDAVPLQFLGVYPFTDLANDPKAYGVELVHPNLVKKIAQKMGLIGAPEYYSSEIQDYLIKYKLNLLFPPQYWKALPWKIGGLSYKQIAEESMNMFETLKANGLTMMITDEEILMAKLAGMPVQQFYDEAFTGFFSGDHEKIKELMVKINNGARAGSGQK